MVEKVAFKTLIAVLNNILGALLEFGYNLYDAENTDYYISEVYYDKEDDKVKIRFKEEEIKKELSEESQN